MKKYLIILLVALSITTTYSQENTYKILYSVEYVNVLKTTTNETEITEEEKQKKEIQNKYIEKYADIQLELIFNSRKSIFKNVDMLIPEKDMYYELALNKVTGKKTYYNDLELNIKMFAINFQGKNYTVNVPTKNFEWQITNETKIIDGYACYKATTHKIMPASMFNSEKKIPVEAWFTTDIMGSYGPCEYDGLPGVILSVYSNNIHIFATSIKTEKKLEINKPNGDIHFENEKEFEKEILKMYTKIKNE